MIRSAVTIALVPQIKTGPWIFWNDLEKSIERAAALGFDGIELFTGAGKDIHADHLHSLLSQYDLALAAVGTGAGKVVHGLTLTDPDPLVRVKAIDFVKEMMDFGAAFGAPAIIGSMQGNAAQGGDHPKTIETLAASIGILDIHAASLGVKLIYEPLNRYETNLINTLDEAVAFIEKYQLNNTKLLADLFHMNIEEPNPVDSILRNARHIGHVHFADSNRRPMGCGHTDMARIAKALAASGYNGFVSAEALPWPDPEQAAAQTINAFKIHFR